MLSPHTHTHILFSSPTHTHVSSLPLSSPPGAPFSKSGFASSSIVILAIATFVVGLCAIPVVKCFIDRRKRERSLDVIQGSNAEDHKHLLKFLDKQLAIGRS